MNNNIIYSKGPDYCYYLLGKSSEFLRAGNLFNYVNEVAESGLIDEYESYVKDLEGWQTKKFKSVFQFGFFRILLYSIVREFKPSLVIETGVLHGMTSGFILQGLSVNKSGKLTSIDLPSVFGAPPANQDGYISNLPQGKNPGWLVSDRLRGLWDLQIGESSVLLQKLNAKNSVNLFIHDSSHTYENMWFELNYAWESLVPGGIIVCDNVEANTSFFDFCRKISTLPLVIPIPGVDATLSTRCGVIRKY